MPPKNTGKTAVVIEPTGFSDPPLPAGLPVLESPEQTVELAPAPAEVTVEPMSDSLFIDDDLYYADILHVGDTRIFLRDLPEPVLIWFQKLGERLETATDGRITRTMVQVMVDRKNYETADEAVKQAIADLGTDDQETFQRLVIEARDRVLVEGIVRWEGPKTRDRPCTSENKLALGKSIREAAVKKILTISTFGGREQAFLPS